MVDSVLPQDLEALGRGSRLRVLVSPALCLPHIWNDVKGQVLGPSEPIFPHAGGRGAAVPCGAGEVPDV